MAYKDKYSDCKKCPAHPYCSTIIGNSKVICENEIPIEKLEEEWNILMECGFPD